MAQLVEHGKIQFPLLFLPPIVLDVCFVTGLSAIAPLSSRLNPAVAQRICLAFDHFSLSRV